ncbi:MAG: hypothetical protein ACOC8C_01835, partial [Chloroflexota bacterium]
DILYLHLALLAYRLDKQAKRGLSRRLKLKREDTDDLLLVEALRQKASRLNETDQTSQVYELLQPYPARVLATVWTASAGDSVQERLLRYQTEWRLVEPEITGDDLKAMGLEPGPLFGELLNMLRDARLNGTVATRDQEVALVEEELASRGHTKRET